MEYNIYDREPGTWQQLEEWLNSAFNEMGYESHRNYSIKTPKGNASIGVFVTENKISNPVTIICECKYWKKPVTQSIINAFERVRQDVGADYGLLISRVGFLSLAEQPRGPTKVLLLDFKQFQKIFFNKWRKSVFTELVKMRDGLLPNLFKNDQTFLKSYKKYALFEKISQHFVSNNKFPIYIVDPRGDIDSSKKITIKSHRHFYKIVNEACEGISCHQ